MQETIFNSLHSYEITLHVLNADNAVLLYVTKCRKSAIKKQERVLKSKSLH